uniref:Glycosyl hydrolase family 38 C-terminal domain-containing protein n=1 Tax=Acrobeloides nanus TaxID=290746 RepID=A0A914DNG2_9BILA
MAINEACFMANIDPLGYQTYFISLTTSYFNLFKNKLKESQNSISNGLIKLVFDSEGYLAGYHDLTNGKAYSLKQEFFYYRGYSSKDANWDFPPSGAYIFRPINETFSFKKVYHTLNINQTIFDDGIVQEARQVISPWVSQVIRLVPNKKTVEFEWTVGPISK